MSSMRAALVDPPILLLHAGIADLRSWDMLAAPLVSAGYRVVRYDARGFGRSQTDDVEYRPHEDVIAVLDALGIGSAVLVGNSQGGRTAIDAAIATPDRVVAVVAVASGLGGFEVESTEAEEAMFVRMEALEEAIEAGGPDAPPIADLVEIDLQLWVDGPGQPPDRVSSSVRGLMRVMDMLHYMPDRVQGRMTRLSPPANQRLGDLRQPVLAVAGELDVSDVAATARHLEANAPNATAVIWPDVAHMIGMEQPDRLAARIVEFLAPLPRWS